MSDEPVAADAPKPADPESLVLRGRPKGPIRFRKGIIVGLGGGLAAALVAIAWSALEPPSFRSVVNGSSGEGAEASSAETLAGTPASYSDVPKLGPPLPGDLGRPILAAERREAREVGKAVVPIDPGFDRAAERADADRRQRAAELATARASSVLVRASSPEAAPKVVTSPPEGEGIAGRSSAKAEDIVGSTPAIRNAPSATLAAGSIIPASLLTALNSDQPGTVIAQVTEPVRDSVSGRVILIPQGSRLIGRYDQRPTYGQRRILLVWQRLLLPDGRSIDLGDMPATDASGMAGLGDRVDRHGWELLKGAVLASLVGVGSELSIDGEGLAGAIRRALQENGSKAGEQLIGRSLDIPPTLRIRPGWPVRVLVTRDLSLAPWEE